MRGKNLVKLIKALELMAKPAGTTINELSEKLEIDRRSVYRLIKLIEELGCPIYDDKVPYEKRKRWKLEQSYIKKLPNMSIPDMIFTLSELVALQLLKGESRLYRGTDIEKSIASAYRKIGMFVPDGLSDKLDKIRALFVPSNKLAKDYSGKEEIISLLTEAILEKKTCFVKYHSFQDDKVKNFKIDPLHFFESNGGLYVFVNATTFGDIRILAVERIQDLKITDDSFEYPADFDPEKSLDSAFNIVFDDPIEVKIWFPADQAKYINERTWAEDQNIIEQQDGSVILKMKTSGWWDVKMWVLSFGAEAVVLEPSELREEIVEEMKTILDIYTKRNK